MLYTVKHVARGAEVIAINGSKYSTPDFREVTSDDDPVVAMKFDDDDAPEIEMLRPFEVGNIAALAVLTADVDGEPKVNIVPEFSFNRGNIEGVVNLTKGDSGSPCFSIMNDGNVRMCGVVAAGNPRDGGGNFIVSCLAKNSEGYCSSDESENSNKLEGVARFNSIRRRFEGNHDGPQDMHRNKVNKYVTAHHGVLISLKDWSIKPAWDDYDEYLDDDEMIDALGLIVEDDDKKVTFSPDLELPPDDGKKDYARERNANQRKKKKQKDRAAQKRRVCKTLSVLRTVKALLSAAYVDQDAKNIFCGLSHGDVPDMTKGNVYNYDDGNWYFEN